MIIVCCTTMMGSLFTVRTVIYTTSPLSGVILAYNAHGLHSIATRNNTFLSLFPRDNMAILTNIVPTVKG